MSLRESRFLTLRRAPQRLAIPLVVLAAISAAASTPSAAQLPSSISSHSDTSAPPILQLHDSLTHLGPFDVAGQKYTVLLHYKTLSEGAPPSAKSTTTLSELQILDAHGNSVHDQNFSYAVSQRRFTETLTASASLLGGASGAALVIRFLDQRVLAPGVTPELAKESWQLFSIVNGRLAQFGPVLSLGQGSNISVNGTMAAVMMKGGIAVMPIASTAEVLSFRAWTGSFYADVPVRFDWPHGQWGEGSQCFQTANGTLTERGCIMPVEAKPQPRSSDADTVYVQLFVAPDGNTDNMQNVPVSPDTHVEILEMQAIVNWNWESRDQRVSCSFRNVWLRTRIDGNEGWVHGQDAFDALGLPLSSLR
jgi:hypothetical protein